MKITEQLTQLNSEEQKNINGGSLIGEIAYCLGVAAKSLVHFCKTASEFQASLPPNLKK